jgi:hypothetical protein
MKYTTKEEVYELQRQHGVPLHSHINGLVTCSLCVHLVVFGKTDKEVWAEVCNNIKMDMLKEYNMTEEEFDKYEREYKDDE